MIPKYYCYLLLLITMTVTSQTTVSDFLGSGEKTLYFRVDPSTVATDVEGSPYINNTYLPSKVLSFEGVTPPMRYNAEKDELEFLKDGKMYYVIKADSLEVVVLDKHYKYLEYQVAKGEESGYLVVVSSNPNDAFALYKKEKITLVPKAEAKSGYDEAKPAHYRREDDKFYLSAGNKIIFMPKKKKELLALFPNSTAEIESYLKENKTSFDNEKDLTNLVKFMNTLK